MARFSIVMTTTDRPNLLAAGVRAVLEMDFDDFELIVSDNFSKIPAAEILKDVHDQRLRIIRTDRRIAVSDHWEFAWEHVGGEYVMYLGDDNALHPNILAFADRAIREHDLDILSWRVCTYFHPDWNVQYGSLPTRGNILGIDVGTTSKVHWCSPDKVLEHFSRTLRFSGCFPNMLNFLFRKELGNIIHERARRLFWAPNPDISSSYLVLGVARPDRYAFFDGFGAIGGRSRHSNLASQLTRGKASRNVHDYLAEFSGQDILPFHEPKFVAMTNTLAAAVSQARALMPELFSSYDFDAKTLALRTIDDLYTDRIVPWDSDPAFLTEVDAFIASLPENDAIEILAYRDESRARSLDIEKREPNGANGSEKVTSEIEPASSDSKGPAGLSGDMDRDPVAKCWIAGGTNYIDMSRYGGQDIADAARSLPRVLADFDQYNDGFVKHYRQLGMLSENLAIEQTPPAAEAMTAAQ